MFPGLAACFACIHLCACCVSLFTPRSLQLGKFQRSLVRGKRAASHSPQSTWPSCSSGDLWLLCQSYMLSWGAHTPLIMLHTMQWSRIGRLLQWRRVTPWVSSNGFTYAAGAIAGRGAVQDQALQSGHHLVQSYIAFPGWPVLTQL